MSLMMIYVKNNAIMGTDFKACFVHGTGPRMRAKGSRVASGRGPVHTWWPEMGHSLGHLYEWQAGRERGAPQVASNRRTRHKHKQCSCTCVSLSPSNIEVRDDSIGALRLLASHWMDLTRIFRFTFGYQIPIGTTQSEPYLLPHSLTCYYLRAF